MKFNILLAGMTLFLLASCGNGNKTAGNDSTTNISDQPSSQATISGTYTGTLPSADCGGLETELTINSDSTYSLKSTDTDKMEVITEQSGVYQLEKDSLLTLFTPSSGEKIYYRVIDNSTVMLSDSIGTINNGELAEFYKLKKSEK